MLDVDFVEDHLEGAGILNQLNVDDAVDLPRLLNIRTMGTWEQEGDEHWGWRSKQPTDSKAHQILHDRELFGETIACLEFSLLEIFGRLFRSAIVLMQYGSEKIRLSPSEKHKPLRDVPERRERWRQVLFKCNRRPVMHVLQHLSPLSRILSSRYHSELALEVSIKISIATPPN